MLYTGPKKNQNSLLFLRTKLKTPNIICSTLCPSCQLFSCRPNWISFWIALIRVFCIYICTRIKNPEIQFSAVRLVYSEDFVVWALLIVWSWNDSAVRETTLRRRGTCLPVCCMVSTDPIVITAGSRQFRVFYAGIFLWSLMCCIIRRVVADYWASFAWVLPTAFISVNPRSLSRITPTFSNFSESRSVILLISGRRNCIPYFGQKSNIWNKVTWLTTLVNALVFI